MGSNKKSNDPNASYGSGGDPRGRSQNMIAHQQDRFEQQQGPLAGEMAYNYGRGAESNYGDYTDIMNQYRNIAGGGGGDGSGGGGGGGYSASTIGYNDPFKSYGGYEEFSKTGGYSGEDVANMRARGTSPIRAAYANAEREVGRQRSLQGGYSPNAIATQAKMAREQGQAGADATQNVEAGLAEARNRGRLAGLGGMEGIEGQRLGADLDVAKFNAQAQMAAAASGSAAAQANRDDQLRALSGMTNLYGTTPGMAQLFGNQALTATNMGAQMGGQLMNATNNAGQLPGQFDQTMDRVGQVTDAIGGVGSAFLNYNRNRQQPATRTSRGVGVGEQQATTGLSGSGYGY